MLLQSDDRLLKGLPVLILVCTRGLAILRIPSCQGDQDCLEGQWHSLVPDQLITDRAQFVKGVLRLDKPRITLLGASPYHNPISSPASSALTCSCSHRAFASLWARSIACHPVRNMRCASCMVVSCSEV